jgi:hypothetical protein
MAYHHMDRIGNLREGDSIELLPRQIMHPTEFQPHYDMMVPNSVTEQGRRYFASGQRVLSRDRDATTELLFEYVRRAFFVDKPSRYCSVYCCETLADIGRFAKAYHGHAAPVWEVEGEVVHRGDMRLLTLGGSALVVSYNAHRYWSGQPYQDKNPLWEVLLKPPVRIVRQT